MSRRNHVSTINGQEVLTRENYRSNKYSRAISIVGFFCCLVTFVLLFCTFRMSMKRTDKANDDMDWGMKEPRHNQGGGIGSTQWKFHLTSLILCFVCMHMWCLLTFIQQNTNRYNAIKILNFTCHITADLGIIVCAFMQFSKFDRNKKHKTGAVVTCIGASFLMISLLLSRIIVFNHLKIKNFTDKVNDDENTGEPPNDC